MGCMNLSSYCYFKVYAVPVTLTVNCTPSNKKVSAAASPSLPSQLCMRVAKPCVKGGEDLANFALDWNVNYMLPMNWWSANSS